MGAWTERIQDYLAVDVETTGLSPERDRIIEIGAVKIRNGECAGEFSRLVKTYQVLPERITQLTGITEEMLRHGCTERDAVEEFLSFAGDTEVILGHNVSFDFGFLKMAAQRYGHSFECMGLDTLRFSKILYPELGSRALTSMCEYLGIAQKNAHRATDDAYSAHFVYRELLSRFPEYDGFTAERLNFKPKKQEPMTSKQKSYLKALLAHHGMEYTPEMELFTKSDASRMIDKLILAKGRM